MKHSPRHIPATMGTQHPDHAHVPYWHTEAFIPTSEEVTECFLSFSELGMSEYMWDWEGKFVDEAVLDRLFMEHQEYFQKHHIGKDKFLTFRLPNPKVEMEHRLGRSFIGMLSASIIAKRLAYEHDPLFEVILPMTESADEMIDVQEAFQELALLKHPLLKFGETSCSYIELLPLFESIHTISDADTILYEYINLHQKKFGFTPSYMRPFLARSDPALNAGMFPTIVSIKIALSRLKQFQKKTEIEIYPILGAAALPFRGGITPYTVDTFIKEYSGIRTVTIQGGFKYDYPKEDVIQAIQKLENILPQSIAEDIPQPIEKKLRRYMKYAEQLYQSTIESIAPIINATASYLPRRRERMQHVGLFGYSRGVGSVRLPRAIGFTAALYSLGIPPEMISTGRILQHIIETGNEELLSTYVSTLKTDIIRSGAYVNKKNLINLSNKISGFGEISKDILELERFTNIEFGPQTEDEKKHTELTGKILELLENNKSPAEYIESAALLRNSLG